MSVAVETTRGADIVALPAQAQRDLTAHVGLVVFLASWAMMFGALFFTFALLRLRAPAWPPPGMPALPWLVPLLNTLVLASSSAALQRAVVVARRDSPATVSRWVAGALGLGAAFLGLQGVGWWGAAAAGVVPTLGIYGGLFWFLTVFHAAHVVVGLGLLAWALVSVRPSVFGSRGRARLNGVALFWHFVGVVWVLTFTCFYLT